MVAGRPRVHDRESIAEELIEWAKLPDSINFNKFCCTREPPIPASKLLQYSKDCDQFRAAYETAKTFIASRREEWLSKDQLHVKAYDLNATVYDLFAKDDKIENAEREAKLRASALKTEAQASAEYTKEVCKAVQRGKKAIK
jgi:hypothetical protein